VSATSALEGTWPLPRGRSDIRVVELAQPVTRDMAGWRGNERTTLDIRELDIDIDIPGGAISATQLVTPAHAGTHVDAARHFYPDGKSIDQYEIGRFVCRTVALDVRREGPEQLTAAELAALDPGILPGDGVLLYFGYAERYADASYYDHPYLSADAADYLVEKQVNLVGVDVLTPDCPAERRPQPFTYPVHTRLLSADVLIVENIGPGVATVLGQWFLLTVPPLRLEDADASPVAPLALVRESGAP
jgi:kynurenine formamidase